MKKFFKFKSWKDLSKMQDPKELRKAVMTELLKGVIIGIVIMLLIVAYTAFDSLALGEKRGFYKDDNFDCIREDYKEAKEYFSEKGWVKEVIWEEDSITVVVNDIKEIRFPLGEYEGCEVKYIREEVGTTIPMSN